MGAASTPEYLDSISSSEYASRKLSDSPPYRTINSWYWIAAGQLLSMPQYLPEYAMKTNWGIP